MTRLQKITIIPTRAFGATALLSLVILAITPAQSQTPNGITVSPKNSDVKVTDSSTPTAVSIKMEGTPTTTEKKADEATKVETLTSEQKAENEKKAAKIEADKKKEAEQASH